MTSRDYCTTCRVTLWDGKTLLGFDHVCSPVWTVWIPEDGETEQDAVEVRGIDAEDAAEEHVKEHYDSDSYTRLEREGVLVCVRDGDGALSKVRVHAEATIEYRSSVEEEAGAS